MILKEFEFEDAIQLFARAYKEDRFFDFDLNFQACNKCEFKTENDSQNLRSGFKECFSKKMDWKKIKNRFDPFVDISNSPKKNIKREG